MNFAIDDTVQNEAFLRQSLNRRDFNLRFGVGFAGNQGEQATFDNLLERTNFEALQQTFFNDFPLHTIQPSEDAPMIQPMDFMIQIFKGLELNYEEMCRELQTQTPPLKIILSQILQNDWKEWEISDDEGPLYGTFLQFFWKYLIHENWNELSTLTIIPHRNYYLFDDRGFNSQNEYDHIDILPQIRNFLSNDLITAGRTVFSEHNIRNSFTKQTIHNDYTLENLGFHRIISFKLFNFFLIFFYKVLMMSYLIRNSRRARRIAGGGDGLEPQLTNDFLHTVTSPHTFYMKFYPLYLHFFQTMNFWLYKKILKNNFFGSGIGLIIPRELGCFKYCVFNNSHELGSFFLETLEPTDAPNITKRNIIDQIGKDVKFFNRIENGRRNYVLPNIRVYNDNLIHLLHDFFQSSYSLPLNMRNTARFQIIFSYYLKIDSHLLGAANNFTSSIQFSFGDLLPPNLQRNFDSFFKHAILLIMAQIEDWLLQRLFQYNPFNENEEDEKENEANVMNVQNLRNDHVETSGYNKQYSFFPTTNSLEQFYSNIALIGFRYISLDLEDRERIVNNLRTFHRDNSSEFNSWIDIYLPPANSHCLQGILFYLIQNYHENGASLLDISGLSQWIIDNLGKKQLIIFSKILTTSKVKKFLIWVNKAVLPQSHNLILYLYNGDTLLKSPGTLPNNLIHALIYNSHIGIFSKSRLDILMTFRSLQNWISLPLFTYVKRKLNLGIKNELPYKLYLGIKKAPLNPKDWRFREHIDLSNIKKLRDRYRNKNKSTFEISQIKSIKEEEKKEKGRKKKVFDFLLEEIELNPKNDFVHYNLLWKLFSGLRNKQIFSQLEGEWIIQQGFYKKKRTNFKYVDKPWNPLKKSKKIKKRVGNKKELSENEIKMKEQEKINDFKLTPIIAWDVETILVNSLKKNEIPKYQVHCICTYSNNENYKRSFWGESSVKDFVAFLSEIFWDRNLKNQKVYFYSFNGARFDNAFLLKPLLQQFYGKVEIVGNIQDIKAMIVGERMFFYDLRLILTRGSLNDLSKSLLKNEIKMDFNIMEYVYDIAKFEGAKNEIIKYCFQDCYLVLLLVENLFKFFFDFLNDLKLTKKKFEIFHPTLSLLALNLWKTITNNTFAILEGVSNLEYYEKIKSSYKGGMCLNITKYKKGPIFHYDIVSSYPFIMKSYAMPIKIKEKKQYFPAISKPPNNCTFNSYTIYKTRFKFKDSLHVPYFPLKTKGGGLIYPLSNFEDKEPTWIWGDELNFGITHHLEKISIEEEISFESKSIFSEYIEILFKARLEAIKNKDEIKKYWLKLLMNSLYGKFGQKKFDKFSIVTGANLHEFLLTNNLTSSEELENSEIPKEKEEIKESMEFLKRVQILDDCLMNDIFFQFSFIPSENYNYIGSLIFISSFIASKARLTLLSGMNDVGFSNILYFDTDSIFTTFEMSPYLIGDELGSWKCEHDNILEAYFLAPKVYACKLLDNQYILHCKGIPEKKLKWEDFLEMYKDDRYLYKNITQLKHEKGEIYFYENLMKELKLMNNKRKFDGDESIPWKSREEMDKKFNE